MMADAIGGPGVRNPEEIAQLLGTAILVGGYVDGRFAWTGTQWGLFPAANHVTITAIPGSPQAPGAKVADCENGDYTPAQAASWAHGRHDRGEWPTVYCSLDLIPAVRQATGSLVLGTDYDIWCADWTGSPHQVPGCAATQYASGTMLAKPYDLSAVYRGSWPARPGTPAPEGITMQITLPELQQGATDPIGGDNIVHRLQGLLRGMGAAWGNDQLASLATDGVFGPATRQAVQTAQRDFGVADDGIVGPDTWPPFIQGHK